MLERAQTRALPLLNKSADVTVGMAALSWVALNACCGACRTCVTTNILRTRHRRGAPLSLAGSMRAPHCGVLVRGSLAIGDRR